MPVTVFSDFDAIPAAIANRLSVRSGLPFFKSLEWFDCLARHGLAAGKPRIYVSQDENGPQCALYCLADGRQLRSLGNFYTIEYGPAVVSSIAGDGLAEIAGQIAAERPRWTTIDLRNLQQNDLERMQAVYGNAGFATHVWHQYDNWYLDVADRSFEDYYATLTSQLRNTIKRKSRKASKAHDIRLAIYPGDGLSLDEATRHYQAVYAASWKNPEPFPEFMPALFETCDKLGLARIGLAWVDDEPAAAQIWIENDGRAFIYKLAYDEKFAEMSIGSMLSKNMFEHAIDTDRVAEIDYGIGSERYKRDWMSDCRALSGLLACNRHTIAGQLRNLREILAAHKRK